MLLIVFFSSISHIYNSPAGGKTTVEIAGSRGVTTLSYDGNYTSEWGDGKEHPDNYRSARVLFSWAPLLSNREFRSATNSGGGEPSSSECISSPNRGSFSIESGPTAGHSRFPNQCTPRMKLWLQEVHLRSHTLYASRIIIFQFTIRLLIIVWIDRSHTAKSRRIHSRSTVSTGRSNRIYASLISFAIQHSVQKTDWVYGTRWYAPVSRKRLYLRCKFFLFNPCYAVGWLSLSPQWGWVSLRVCAELLE